MTLNWSHYTSTETFKGRRDSEISLYRYKKTGTVLIKSNDYRHLMSQKGYIIPQNLWFPVCKSGCIKRSVSSNFQSVRSQRNESAFQTLEV